MLFNQDLIISTTHTTCFSSSHTPFLCQSSKYVVVANFDHPAGKDDKTKTKKVLYYENKRWLTRNTTILKTSDGGWGLCK